jgi:hypothetical protein
MGFVHAIHSSSAASIAPVQHARDDLTRPPLGRNAVVTIALMARHRIYSTSVASVYPHYVNKAERKGRTKDELDEIIRWLTGYDQQSLETTLANETDFETFFAEAPAMNAARRSITGTICGVRIEEIEEPLMQEIRYLDKLVDELAKGKPMTKILRSTTSSAPRRS